ncbi:hypothetical protein BC830DRAFT_171289 [Chytriomyces sp. MP71]|nr:hypothetical protein BC830DRAFT_171289 [Chytriomyces sp. MP71]
MFMSYRRAMLQRSGGLPLRISFEDDGGGVGVTEASGWSVSSGGGGGHDGGSADEKTGNLKPNCTDNKNQPTFVSFAALLPSLSLSLPLQINQTKTRLPHEVIVLILAFVQSNNTLFNAALVCRAWSAAAVQTLWHTVHISSPEQMRRFLRCSIRTVARHSPAQAESLLNLVQAIDQSEITQISSLPRVDISPENMIDMAQMLNGALQQQQQQQQQPAAVGGMQIGGITGPFPVPLPPVMANLIPFDPNGPLNDNDPPIPPQILQFMASLQHMQQSSMDSASQDQDDDNVVGIISSWNTLHTLGVDFKSIQDFGFCSHVRRLALPTFDTRVRHTAVLTELLPNLMSLHLQHVHPPEVMTGDRPRALFTPIPYAVLRCFAPLIARVVKLTAEDVYIPCWTELLRILKFSPSPTCHSSSSTPNQRNGLAIKSLNLEAVATTDSFDSDEKLASVFANLPHLEAARFDGIAVGTDAAFLILTRSCVNLSVIAVDYCPLVTMSAFNILWNNAPNLVFLGLAGIVNDQHLHHLLSPILYPNHQPDAAATATHASTPLVTHTNLRVLRLVDCDVTDTLCAHIANSAPNLDMLRIVFEDDACEGILQVVESLTDAALLAFATRPASVRRMTRLAVTWCPAFTADALREVVHVCGVEVLDLHKDALCELGLLPDSVLTECLDDGGLAGVKVLNLYGQVSVLR